MIDTNLYQTKLDNCEDSYPIIDELFRLKESLEKEGKLTYFTSLCMFNFLRKNTNQHLNYVIKNEKNKKEANENEVSNTLGKLSSNLTDTEKFEYILTLLDKSNKSYDSKLKEILLANLDIVEKIEQLANVETEKVETKISNYPLAICAKDCECYGIEFKEAEEYGVKLNYEPYLNYIEFLLFKDGNMVGLVEHKLFLENFITELE